MKYVLYHSNCYDGFGAAYAAWKKMGDEAKYIPVSYGKPPPEMPDATEIFIVDFSYDEPELLELSVNAKVFVLDHHKTAQEKLARLIKLQEFNKNPYANLYIEFDMERSGALITWEFFHGAGNAPMLIQHISDRDLWTYKILGSREVHAALVSTPFDFEVWDKLDVPTLVQDGAGALKFQTQLVQNIIKKSWIAKMGEFEFPVVNTASSWSEVGEALLDKYPDAPFVGSFTEFEDSVMWSLRSRDDRQDVSEVAKSFGGGGHRNAAGFQRKKIRSW